MVSGYNVQQRSNADDTLNMPIRVRRRSALQELSDYPFFGDDEDQAPAPSAQQQSPSWVARHGGLCLTALAVVGAIEVAVLGFLLH